MTVNSIDGEGRMSATGCDAQGIGTIGAGSDTGAFFKDTLEWATPIIKDIAITVARESNLGPKPPSKMVVTQSSLADWTVCTDSNQCIIQCCSGKYSGGILKCTPTGGFKPWEGCVGSSATVVSSATPMRGEWEVCGNSNQCINRCCSGKYSGGILKCTPVGGFKPGEGCTGSATRNLRRGGDDAESGLHSAADDKTVEELVWDSLEYEAAAEDMHGAVLN